MKKAILFVFAAPLLAGQIAQAASIPSHCSAQEQVIFSCKTSKTKVVSLCASSPLTASSGYMQYRFGPPGSKPELVYPQNQVHPKGHFKSGTLTYSGGGGAYLEFNQGEYKYVLFSGVGKGWEKEGVVVSKSGKQVAVLECRGEWDSQMGPDFFERAAIPPADDDFEIPVGK
jgi:hypothetical protein